MRWDTIGFAADDLNGLIAADQLHAAAIRAEKELVLLVVGIDQADQRAELYAFAGVVRARVELSPMGHRLADGFGTTGLAGGQVGGFEPQCVVLVFGDVLFVGRRFMGRPHRLFGLQQVFSKPMQHLLLQQEFIHGEGSASRTSRTSGGQVLIMKGSTSLRRFRWLTVNFAGRVTGQGAAYPPLSESLNTATA